MLKSILGKPNDIKQDILVSFVKGDENFTIEDINPNDRKGLPSYLVKIDCLYLDDNYKFINTKKLEENLTLALEGIKVFGNEKMNVGFIENFKLSYELATVLFLISKKISDYNFTVFLKTFRDKTIFSEMENSIKIFKENSEFRKSSISLYGEGVLNQGMESVVKRTFGLKDAFKGKTLVIIDTHNQHHRNWHGMPDMRNTDDEPTGVIKAFTTLVKGLPDFKADYTLFASEGKNGIRFQIDKEYKATRSKIQDDLKFQIKQCDELTKRMGYQLISEEGFEADDIIGAYTRTFENLGGKVIILSSDKDMYQLISDNVRIFDTHKRRYVTEEDWLKKFDLPPEKIIYSLAIQGDVSDNVPGIKGVGKVGAAKLINEFGDIDGIIAGADTLKKSKMKENILAGFDDLRMSYELVRLYDFLAIDVDWNKFKTPVYNPFFLVYDELERFQITV